MSAQRPVDSVRSTTLDFRALIDVVQDYAIFALDETGHVLSWNRGAEHIKGYTAEEIIGRHFSIFYPAEDVAQHKPDRELEVVEREGRIEDEGWRVRKGGSRFWASVVITALRDEAGELIGFAKVTRDLTERVAAEEAARLAIENRAKELSALLDQVRIQAAENVRLYEAADRLRIEAEHANQAKSEFLAMMSHELRTPLNAIRGYAELIETGVYGPVTDPQRTALTRIARSEAHLLGLINNILQLAKLDAGPVTLAIAELCVRDLLASAEDMMATQMAAKGLDFQPGACDPELTVRADAEKVRQILLNLLGNALKFTQMGGSVRTECDADDTCIFLRVRDTGRGIHADLLAAIFEPFMQVSPSLTESSSGVGLGLAISRDLARAMGGELMVTSVVGDGSTFTLQLPRGKAV